MKDELADGGRNQSSASSPLEPEFDAPMVSQDNIFDALASKRSRYVLLALRQLDEPIEIADLVDHLAAWEMGTDIDDVSNEHCKRVLTSLRHSQLPKLSMMGLIEYDDDEWLVERGPYAEQADAYLDIAVERDENVDS